MFQSSEFIEIDIANLQDAEYTILFYVNMWG